MSFLPSAFNCALDTIGGGSIRVHGYRPIDEDDDVYAAGYFTNAVGLGIRVGDLIVVLKSTGAELGTISDITNGSATLTPDQASQYAVFSTQTSVETARIVDGVNYITVLGREEAGDHPPTRFKLKQTSPTVAPTNNLAWVIDRDGRYWINDEPEINARTLGVRGGGRKLLNASMTLGSFTLISSGAGFSTSDIGKKACVLGVGTYNSTLNKDSQLIGTITAVAVSGNSCTLNVAATTTASGQYAVIAWDETVALSNACRAAATLERFCYLPDGIYLTTDSITGLNGYSNFRLRGDGPGTILIHAGLDAQGTQISCVGAIPTPTWLTAPASIGDNVLSLNSAANISIISGQTGGLIVISAQDKPQYTNTSDPSAFASLQGEVARVKSFDTDANTVTLEAGIIYNYNGNTTSGSRTTVGRIDAMTGLRLQDMKIEHVSPSTNVNTFHVSWNRALRPECKNLFFQHTGAQCIPISTWIDGKAHGIGFDYIGGPEALDPLDWGYGLSVTGACWQLEIYDVIGYRLRHVLTSGGFTTGPGPQHVHLSNITASGCRVNIDTHEGGRHWTIDNCHMVSGAKVVGSPVPDASGPGFQIRIYDTVVSNCTVVGGSMGFFTPYGERVKFVNCHARNVGTGFNITNSPGAGVYNCTVTDYKTMGVLVMRDPAGALSTMPGIELKHVYCYGNPTVIDENDQTQCYEPCGFQFGWWAGDGITFNPQWQKDWVIEDIKAEGAHIKFKGLPSTSVAYGPLKQDTVLFETVPRTELDTSAIAALATGEMHLTAINLPKGEWVTKLGTIFGSAGTTQTNLWFSLWTDDLDFLGVTSNGTTTEPTPDILTFFDVATPFMTPYEGLYYFGHMATGAAMPSVWGKAMGAAMATLEPVLCGTSNTGLTNVASIPAISAATSTTSQDIRDFDIKSTLVFTTQAGKAFTTDMPILIASNANSANFMRAFVVSYASTTLKVRVYDSGGSGVHTDWDITGIAKATAITADANRLYGAVG